MIVFPMKLVRDKLPGFIVAKGGRTLTRQLRGVAYRRALADKLIEEAREVANASTRQELIEELADLLEVAEAIRMTHMIPDTEVKACRRSKSDRLGFFAQGMYMLFGWD